MKQIISLIAITLFVLQTNAQQIQLADIKMAPGYSCSAPELKEAQDLIQKQKRYVNSRLQAINDILPELQKNASDQAFINGASKLLFFSSVSLLASSGAALWAGLARAGGLANILRYNKYSDWAKLYAIANGAHPQLAAYESLIGLWIWPVLITPVGAEVTFSMLSAGPSEASIRKNDLKALDFKPTKANAVRLGMGLNPADIRDMVSDIIDTMIVKTEVDLNTKLESGMSKTRLGDGFLARGLFNGNLADYTQALLVSQLARKQLYDFHLSVLADQEKDIERICKNQ